MLFSVNNYVLMVKESCVILGLECTNTDFPQKRVPIPGVPIVLKGIFFLFLLFF